MNVISAKIASFKKKALLWSGVLMLTLSVGAFAGMVNNSYFSADLTADPILPGITIDSLYIPGYFAAPGGGQEVLEIKARNTLEPFDNLTFTLSYDPNDSLSFESQSVIFEPGDLLSDSMVQSKSADGSIPGKLSVVLDLNQPLDLSTFGEIDTNDVQTHPILFRLRTNLDSLLEPGDAITIAVSDFSVSKGSIPLTGAGSISAGGIVINRQDSTLSSDTETPTDNMNPSAQDDQESDSSNKQVTDGPFALKLGITTTPTTVLAVFNNEINPSTVSLSDFRITAQDDSSDTLELLSFEIDSRNRIVNLETSVQTPEKAYSLSVENIEDAQGNLTNSNAVGQTSVIGFSFNGSVPNIASVTPKDTTNLEIAFTTPLDPSSVYVGQTVQGILGEPFSVSITEEKTGRPLRVIEQVLTSSKSILITTEASKPNQTYILDAGDRLKSYDGTFAIGKLRATFVGLNQEAASNEPSDDTCEFYADIICDGKIDFDDFGVFAFYYDSTYSVDENGNLNIQPAENAPGSSSQNSNSTPMNNSPQGSNSNGALVPTNSTPASGTIVN